MENKTKNILDTLLERAEQAASDKPKYINLKSAVVGEVAAKIPTTKKVFEYIDSVNDSKNNFENLLVNAEITYDAIAILRDNYQKLSEAYDEKDPAMLTIKIFESAGAVGEINDIADKLLEASGVMRRVVKN